MHMFAQIEAAAQRLHGVAKLTPVITSDKLNQRLGCEVLFKCENLQPIGAFKIRGAYNAMSKLSDSQKKQGVITFSSGNHAQAIAYVGRLLGISTTIVMPVGAPLIKRKATMEYGATIHDYDPDTQNREEVAAAIMARQPMVLIPPYDHEDVIAGQGTAAYELLSQQPGLTQLLVPCGGGGLLSGSAVAAKHLNPHCRVTGIEPETANDATLSFRSGQLQRVDNPQTIADGTRTPSLGKIPFALIKEYVDDMQTVSEIAIKQAVSYLLSELKLLVEPSGALGLAALLTGKVVPTGKVGVILSGGNIDHQTLCRILQSSEAAII